MTEQSEIAPVVPSDPNDGVSQLVDTERQVLQLHVEELTVAKRQRETMVRAAVTTLTREQIVDEELVHQHVVVERVPLDRVVDAVPPIREEGDEIIVPVVEEIVVVERRLILREEVRLRRVRSTERHVETVSVREQQVVVTREPASKKSDMDT